MVDRNALERFRQNWEYDNPLRPSMLGFAGRAAVVHDVGFHHGGDPLYVLLDIPGVWREACLAADTGRRLRKSL
jgi:hypothetical protein